MGFVCGAEDEQWLNPVRQDHQTELLFILCEAQDGAWHWTQSRQATRGLHTYPFLSVCVFVLVSAVLDPQDTHPPISQNSTEDVMLREQWNPATNALACEISEGMWGTAVWSDNVLLKIPKHSLEASCLAGRGSADYVRKSLSAVCSHHPVEYYLGSNQYRWSNFSFDMCTFGGSVFYSTMWVAHKPKGNHWL